MMTRQLLLSALVLVGCVGGGPVDAGVGGGASVGGGSAGGSGSGGGGGAADAGVDAGLVPLIGEVLTCGALGSVGGLGPGGDLERFNLTEFPDALCNDGTPALLYFRPAWVPASRNRWVIFLQGGGSCDDPRSCAERWCATNTNFGQQGMSALPAPAGIAGNGIFEHRGDNQLATFNQVFLKYCSSDLWSGTARDLTVHTVDPQDGGPRTFRLHRLGARIIDAALEVLRRDAGATLRASDGGTLADLDDAELVILAGASAGGAGVIQQADRVGQVLRAHNTNASALVYRGLIDSIFAPNLETLGYGQTQMCDAGLCTWAAWRRALEQQDFGAPHFDESCLTFHADAGTYACNDQGHVVRHHLTTPFLVRQGQTDVLLASMVHEAGFTQADGGTLTLGSFASLVRADLGALSTLQASAEEGAAVTVAPAVFGPTCSKHETLTDDAVFDVTIDAGADAGALRVLDVAQRWLGHGTPTSLIAGTVADNTCVP